MITRAEIDTLRKQGLSDDDILKGYQEFDTTHNADIGALTKNGLKSGEILEGLADFRASTSKPEPKAETWGDTATNFVRGAQYGVAGVASGLGRTLEATGYDTAGPILGKAGKFLAPSGYGPASSQFDITSPSTYGYAPRALVESVPGLAVDLVGGAAGALTSPVTGPAGPIAGFAAAHTARTYGDNLDDRMRRDGKKLADATGADQAIALGASAGEGALGAVGLRGLPLGKLATTTGAGSQALSQLPGQIATAGARDALANAAGNVVQQTGRTIGTEQGFDINAHEAANAAGLGAITGAGLRATTGLTRDAYQSNRLKGLMDDPESSTRVAAALKGTDLDLTDAKAAGDALKIVQGQIQRSTKGDAAKAFLKDADGDTRAAVADGLDRLRIGQTLSSAQLTDLNARLGGVEAASTLLRGITDHNTLNAVKGLGSQSGGRFEGNSFQNSALNRATNPFSRYGAGAAGAAAAATQIPAAASAMAALSPYALAGAGAIGGIQAVGRGADRLLATRTPLDQFVQRFEGFRPSEPVAAPVRADVEPSGPSSKEMDRAWARARALQAREAAAQARKDSDVDKAYAERDAYGDADAKARDEAAMWKARDREEAAGEQPRDFSVLDAKDAIGDAYKARNAESARVVDASNEARLRARAMATLKAQQETKAREAVAAEEATAAKTAATRSREYDRAEAQREASAQPSVADRAKTAQMAAMWKAKADRDVNPKDGWTDAEAITAIRQAEAARKAEGDAALRANSIERAAANPIPVNDVITAQPKGQTPSISERAKAKVKPPKAEADAPKAENAKADRPARGEGDFFEHEGIRHAIPDDVKNRAGYISSIKRNQSKINRAVDKAYDDGQIEQKTFIAIKDRVEELKTARSKKQARNIVSEITKEVHPNDRQTVMKAFDADFLNIWSKEE